MTMDQETTTQTAPSNGNANGNGNGTLVQVSPRQARLDKIGDYLGRNKRALMDVMPKHLTAERLTKLTTSLAARTPELLECTAQSILVSLIDSATLGLEPSTPLGHSYLIPYQNKIKGTNRKRWECQLIIGYRGYIQLAHWSGVVADVSPGVIYEEDEWDYSLGTKRFLHHIPKRCAPKDRGVIVAFYDVVTYLSGHTAFELMYREEVDAIRDLSPAAGSGPWVDHYVPMGKKTVIRAHCKTLPMSSEKPLGRAVAMEDAREYGSFSGGASVIDVLPEDEDQGASGGSSPGAASAEPAKSRGDDLAAKLGGRT